MRHNYSIFITRNLKRIFSTSIIGILFSVIFTTGALISYSLVEGSVQNERERTEKVSALSLVEVGSIAAQASRSVDSAALQEISNVTGVERLYPWMQIPLTLEDEEVWPAGLNPGSLPATPWIPELAPAIISGHVDSAGPREDEIILPHLINQVEMDNLVGQEISFGYQVETSPGQGEVREVKFKVIATADNSVSGLAGLQPTYMSYQTLEKINVFEQNVYPLVYVKVQDPQKVIDVQNSLAQMGFGVTSISEKMPQLYGLLRIVQYLSYVLFAVALATSIILGFLIGSAWVRYILKDLALMKMLGYSNKDLTLITFGQLAFCGIILAVITIITGLLGSWAVSAWLSSDPENFLGISTVALPGLGINMIILLSYPLTLVISGIIPARKVSRVDMDNTFRAIG